MTCPDCSHLERDENPGLSYRFYFDLPGITDLLRPVLFMKAFGGDQMQRLHQSIQDAVGPSYVYQEYEADGRKAFLYFDNSGNASSPRIYLKVEEQGASLIATIHSPVDYAVKRHRDPDD